MPVTQAQEDEAVQGQEEAESETATAFDSAVSEFLAYLKGYRQPALSEVERVLAVDGRGVSD